MEYVVVDRAYPKSRGFGQRRKGLATLLELPRVERLMLETQGPDGHDVRPFNKVSFYVVAGATSLRALDQAYRRSRTILFKFIPDDPGLKFDLSATHTELTGLVISWLEHDCSDLATQIKTLVHEYCRNV